MDQHRKILMLQSLDWSEPQSQELHCSGVKAELCIVLMFLNLFTLFCLSLVVSPVWAVVI